MCIKIGNLNKFIQKFDLLNFFCFILTLFFNPKFFFMKDGFLDIKSPNWLGGVNVHNTLALIGIGFLVFKAWKK
jgi:hypothetical protein